MTLHPYDDWIDAAKELAEARGLDWHDARYSDYPWFKAWEEFGLAPDEALDDYLDWTHEIAAAEGHGPRRD